MGLRDGSRPRSMRWLRSYSAVGRSDARPSWRRSGTAGRYRITGWPTSWPRFDESLVADTCPTRSTVAIAWPMSPPTWTLSGRSVWKLSTSGCLVPLRSVSACRNDFQNVSGAVPSATVLVGIGHGSTIGRPCCSPRRRPLLTRFKRWRIYWTGVVDRPKPSTWWWPPWSAVRTPLSWWSTWFGFINGSTVPVRPSGWWTLGRLEWNGWVAVQHRTARDGRWRSVRPRRPGPRSPPGCPDRSGRWDRSLRRR